MFGKWGDRLYDFARGIDPRPVVVEHERKSVGTEQTFDTDQMQIEPLGRTLREQAGEIERMLREGGQLALTVTLKVRYSNFQRVTRQRTFSAPVQDAGEIGAIACDLLKLTEAGQRPVRLIGVSVSGFVPQDGWEEMPLFGNG
jgi:DNA polymerase-4